MPTYEDMAQAIRVYFEGRGVKAEVKVFHEPGKRNK
jgi:hypothetical protein